MRREWLEKEPERDEKGKWAGEGGRNWERDEKELTLRDRECERKEEIKDNGYKG